MSFESYRRPRTRTNDCKLQHINSKPQTNLHMVGRSSKFPFRVVGPWKVRPAEAFFSVSEPHSTWTATQIHRRMLDVFPSTHKPCRKLR